MLFLFSTVCRSDDAATLRARYQELLPALQQSALQAPLHLASEDRDGRVVSETHGILEHDFATLRNLLTTPAGWCELVMLHRLVKGCAAPVPPGAASVLTFYSGGPHYTPIEDARRLDYVWRLRADGADFLSIALDSDEGPIDTYEYQLLFEAIPLESGRTFARFRFSFRYGSVTRVLSAAYYALIARSQVGFTVVGTSAAGAPIYVSGRIGAVERNVMGFYLALQTLLEGALQPEAERFEWRLRRWYALCDRYRRQLHEIEEKEYLDMKRRERAEQMVPTPEVWPAPKS